MPGYIGYVGDKTCLVETKAGFFLYCNTQNVGISPHLMKSGEWEPHLTRYFQTQNLKGSVCIDVGANAGYYSMLFSYGNARKVYAFEPLQKEFKLLKMSTDIYAGKTDFHLENCGASDGHKGLQFTEEENRTGGSRINEAGLSTIKTITIDSLDIPSVDFMKIDVEGHEPQVLTGAKDTITRSLDKIKIVQELYSHPGTDYDKVEDLWESLGLKPQIIGHGRDLGRPIPYSREAVSGTLQDILLTKK